MKSLRISPNKLSAFGVNIKQDGVIRDAFQLLSFPGINFDDLDRVWPEIDTGNSDFTAINPETKNQVAINALYSSYLKRQESDLQVFQKDAHMKIPLDLEYNKVQSLSNEVRQKLSEIRPTTIASALRIQGITPASMMALMVYIKNSH